MEEYTIIESDKKQAHVSLWLYIRPLFHFSMGCSCIRTAEHGGNKIKNPIRHIYNGLCNNAYVSVKVQP